MKNNKLKDAFLRLKHSLKLQNNEKSDWDYQNKAYNNWIDEDLKSRAEVCTELDYDFFRDK